MEILIIVVLLVALVLMKLLGIVLLAFIFDITFYDLDKKVEEVEEKGDDTH